MKKVILLFAVAITIFSCSTLAEGEFIITGNVKGLKSGLVYLEKQSADGMSATAIDTVKIIDGKFEIKGKINEPEIHFIGIEKVNGKLPFILEEGEIEMEIDKDSLFKSKLGGTYNNEEFYTFNEESGKIQKSLQKKVTDFQTKNMAKLTEAQSTNDTVVMNALRKEYENIQKELTDYTFDYPKDHPKSYISLLITQAMFSNRKFKVNDIETSFNALDESLKSSKIGKEVKEGIEKIKKQEKAKASIAVGKMAPDFKAPDLNGKTTSLKENLGKITLLDFWASWCAPCRAENPNVVALYNEFHSKGLNIISISLDNDAAKWKEAVAKDKLTWTNLNLSKEFKSPVVEQYGISQIPTTYLLDETGKIIAIDLRGEELKEKVSALLTSK